MVTVLVDYTKVVFDEGVSNMNEFLNNIKQFEQITN